MSFPLRRCLTGLLAGLLAPFALGRPPEVSPAVTKLIEALFTSPAYEQFALSPTGKYAAFLREEDGHKVLATIDLRTGAMYGAGGSWRQDIATFQWCGADTLIFHLGREDIYDQGLFLADAEMRNIHQVKSGHRVLAIGQVRSDVVFLSVVGREQTSMLDEGFSDLERLDPRRNEISLAEANPGRVIGWLADQSGRVRVAVRMLKDWQTAILLRPGADPAWQMAPMPTECEPLTFDPSGRYLMMQFRGEGGRQQIQTYDIQQRQFVDKPLADPVYDIAPTVITDPRSWAPVGLWYNTDHSHVYWLDPGYARIQAKLAPVFPGQGILPWGLMYNGDIVFSAGSDVLPESCYRLNAKTGQITELLPSLPLARGRTWAPMQPVEFPARDGYVLHGYLTLPVHRPAAQRVPLIALSHGGPRLRDERDFNREVQFYAGLGYGVLQVNYRGSDGFGLAHLQTDIIAVGHISVDDVADGLRWTVAQGYADPKRLVAMGGSYGGYIAMGLATRYPELTAAVVGFAGVYDWRKHIELATYNHATAYAWMSRYFPPVKDREQDYAAISPVTMAAQVRAPVLLLHGESDEVVDIEQSELMRKALLKAGKSVQLVADVANIHGLPKQQSRFDYYRTVTAFLLANAPPDAAP